MKKVKKNTKAGKVKKFEFSKKQAAIVKDLIIKLIIKKVIS